jgi:hypothetical protein
MNATRLLVLMALLSYLATGASALTVTDQVTPEIVKQNPKVWTITAKKTADHMIAFTITHAIPKPLYVIASLRIRDGEHLLFTSDFPAYIREEGSTTCYFSISGDLIANSEFELSASTFVHSHGEDVPIPGTVISVIRLKDFAP